MDAKGSIVVDELILPIVDIYLEDEKFWVTAQVTGPVPAMRTGLFVVCDRLGGVVWRSQGAADRIQWSAVKDGVTLQFSVALSVEGRTSTPRPFIPHRGWGR